MSDRAKTYALLARLHNQEMETRAGALVALQDEAEGLLRERDALERSRRDGASVSMIEAMPYRGRFLQIVRRENQRLTSLISDVEQRIEAQRNVVLEAYREARSTGQLEAEVRAESRRASQEVIEAEADELILLRRIASGC